MGIHNWKDYSLQKKVSQTLNQIFQFVKFVIAYLNYNKMPKLALVNGLWIGVALIMLQNLTMVEKTLIACYHCWDNLI
jgi:hypothetical protein